MAARPALGAPTSSARAPSNSMTQVGEAWIPSLCSIDPQLTPLGPPSEPSAFTSRFGARNSEMPREPGGAFGMRASTRWTTLSAMSWSPQVMKIFWPVMRQPPSPSGSARVVSAPRSEPACGSVRFIVPVHSPETIFGT